LVFVFFINYGSEYLDLYLNSTYSFDTFSGRTLLWDGILSELNYFQLIFGNGFNTSSDLSGYVGRVIFGVDGFTQAHSAVVESIINSGLIGCFLLFYIFSLVLKQTFYSLIKLDSLRSTYVFISSITILILLRLFLEGSIAQPGAVDAILFCFIVTAYSFKLPNS
jgi:O-antigen ligase